MDEIKLSIIIPLYNGREFIQETVNGLLNIKCQKEILIIDDGSKDGSYEYCKKLWETNPDIKLFSKKNSGIVDTRNFGIEHASGKYLFFSDHDDVIYSKVIDEAVKQAEEEKLDGMIWSTVRLIGDGQCLPCDNVYRDCIVYKEEIINTFIPSMLINTENEKVSYLGHVWAGIYKRDLVEKGKIRFKRFIDIEDDYLFVFDFLNVATSLGLMCEIGYAWRFNQKSETYRLKYIDGILEKYRSFYNYLSQSVEKMNVSVELQKKYEQYQIQNTLVMAIENSYIYLNKSRTDQYEIKEYYNNNRDCFKVDSVFPYAKRRKRIYFLLKHGMFNVATIYIYLDSLYRRLKNF